MVGTTPTVVELRVSIIVKIAVNVLSASRAPHFQKFTTPLLVHLGARGVLVATDSRNHSIQLCSSAFVCPRVAGGDGGRSSTQLNWPTDVTPYDDLNCVLAELNIAFSCAATRQMHGRTQLVKSNSMPQCR